MACFQVGYTSVAALLNAEKHFPPKTPKRWSLIAEYVKKASEEVCGSGTVSAEEPIMILGSAKEPTMFQYKADHCKQLFTVLNSRHSHILSFEDLQQGHYASFQARHFFAQDTDLLHTSHYYFVSKLDSI